MATSIVKVYNSRYSEWAENVRVELVWSGISNLGSSESVLTNRNGIAEINHTATGNCTVYIDGRKANETFYAPGSITITL
jgi:hypothetical protein